MTYEVQHQVDRRLPGICAGKQDERATPVWLVKISQVRRHALSLPEATEEPHHHLMSFRVRGRIFVTFPPDGTYIHVFVPEEPREQALSLKPSFVEKLFWAGKVAGLRVTLAQAKPATVKWLVSQAWAHKAPKSLAAQATTAS